MGLLMWIIFGFVLGITANMLDPRPSEGGALGAVVLGVVGAFLGGILAEIVLGTGYAGFSFAEFSVALLGSLLLLLIGRAVRKV